MSETSLFGSVYPAGRNIPLFGGIVEPSIAFIDEKMMLALVDIISRRGHGHPTKRLGDCGFFIKLTEFRFILLFWEDFQ